MCMLTAVVSKKPRLFKWEETALTFLLMNIMANNAASGNKDGTGLYSTGDLLKVEDELDTVYLHDDWTKFIEQHANSPIIGHVRTSSAGFGAKDGSHPFVVGNIALAHNGTFLNYRMRVKEVKSLLGDDPDPVDSHVFAAHLAKAVGDTPLTADHIIATAEKFGGSFALLIGDLRVADQLWVVTGTNSLYIAEVGPFWVVNTTGANIKSAAMYSDVVSHYMIKHTLGLSTTPKKISPRTINLLSPEGLEKVGDVPVSSHTKTVYRDYRPRYYPPRPLPAPTTQLKPAGTTIETGEVELSQTQIVNRAAAMTRITTEIKGIWAGDISMVIWMIFKCRWPYVPASALEVLYETLKDIYTDDAEFLAKASLWKEIRQLANYAPYTQVGQLVETFQVPWPLNSIETLTSVRDQLRYREGI